MGRLEPRPLRTGQSQQHLGQRSGCGWGWVTRCALQGGHPEVWPPKEARARNARRTQGPGSPRRVRGTQNVGSRTSSRLGPTGLSGPGLSAASRRGLPAGRAHWPSQRLRQEPARETRRDGGGERPGRSLASPPASGRARPPSCRRTTSRLRGARCRAPAPVEPAALRPASPRVPCSLPGVGASGSRLRAEGGARPRTPDHGAQLSCAGRRAVMLP